ncbi:hypothetical protein [Pseudidiomarina sp.]|uniref:hypothetical protein n=1 Tax=Pseudidiomarina sp. TaxID=2081707 RepID=UPI003A96FFD7
MSKNFSPRRPILTVLMGFVLLFTLTGCDKTTPQGIETVSESVAAPLSDARVCNFAQRLAALPQQPIDTAELRYLNEQWRELNRTDDAFSVAEAAASRAILSALNIELAHESAQLIKQAIEITAETYEQIEGLRRYASDPDNMKVPDSITRTLVNRLNDCCLNQLNGNATALVREEKYSPLYNIGSIAYFINRDVNQILRNELELDRYRARVAAAKAALPAPQNVSTAATWAQCKPNT